MSLKIKKKLKEVLPHKLTRCYRKINRFFLHIKNKDRPVSQVFSEIYSENKWGESRKSGEFYSGPGSEGVCVKQYCDTINSFIRSLGKNNIRIVDLGCGDFRVGGEIAKQNNIDYIGVDVVPALIERNKSKYSNKNTKFICLDIISEELPDGDICLVRQVLQHLSNSEIKKIIGKISKYKYVFITESHPPKIESYNEDKPHGQDTRLYNGSGVYLDKPPFNVKNIELVLSVPCGEEEEINTFLIKNIKS